MIPKWSIGCVLLASAAFGQNYDVALITKGQTNEYWKTLHAGVLKAQQDLKAEGINVKLTWEAPSTESANSEQVAQVNAAAGRHASGILLSPTNVKLLGPPVEAAAQAGIPTVVIDSGLRSTSQVSFIATDNYKGGLLGARRLGALLGGHGRVILFRFLKDSAGTEAREAGFLDTMAHQFRNIQVIDSSHYAGGTYDEAHHSAAELLKSQGANADGIFCSNDMSAVGMLQALREAGLAGGKVKLVVFDSSQSTLAGLTAGDVQSLIVQNPFKMGYVGLETLVASLGGKPVEHNIDTGCTVVTAENLSRPEIAALIHPGFE